MTMVRVGASCVACALAHRLPTADRQPPSVFHRTPPPPIHRRNAAATLRLRDRLHRTVYALM
jgi:hypothetical protein